MNCCSNTVYNLHGYVYFGLTLVFVCQALLASVNAVNSTETVSPIQQQHKCFTLIEVEEAASREGVDAAEFGLTEPICLPLASGTNRLDASLHNGIPDGTVCDSHSWCDSQGMCSRVCKKGTVQIDSWYQWAAAWQRNASRTKPLCHASLLGSHNSAITIADGYGNQDSYWQSFLEYLPTLSDKPILRTNNQWLSLTDQLNLGVRVVEVDTHWFEGGLRAAHCGGLHSKPLNQFISFLNSLSKLTGNRIRWDTETVGCSPSLSSIPVRDQRHVSAVLEEVADWLRAPANCDEFLVVFFDDEKDIAKWGKVSNLIETIQQAFPSDWLFTPALKAHVSPDQWPSIAEMRSHGARVLLINRRDFGAAANALMFRKEDVCAWFEPSMWELSPPPQCGTIIPSHSHPQDGSFSRVNDCKLVYGPLNCDFVPRSSADRHQQFTSTSIQATSMCGWNCISPDWLTPALAHGTIWSWAPGEPRSLGLSPLVTTATSSLATPGGAPGTSDSTAAERDTLRARADAMRGSVPGECVAMSSLDGRWRSVSCDDALPIACKGIPPDGSHMVQGPRGGSPPNREEQGVPVWNLGCVSVYSAEKGWTCDELAAPPVREAQEVLGGSVRGIEVEAGDGSAGRADNGLRKPWPEGGCAPGFVVAYPETAWENVALWQALAGSGEARVMLPLRPQAEVVG